MSESIQDHLLYNNVPYKEIDNQQDIKLLDDFALKIREEKLEELLLSFNLSHTFNARLFEHDGRSFISSFPDDFSNKLIVIWIGLTEK